MNEGEQLAIIKDVGFGIRDANRCKLWFTVAGENWGALQSLSVEEAVKLIEKNKIVNIQHLNGRPCIVDISSVNIVKFLRLIEV